MRQTSDLTTRVLLLVEDNQADAELVMDMLGEDSRQTQYEVHHVARLAEAEEMLRDRQVDVVLLDLRLPDSAGVESVRSVLSVAKEMPVIVLTGLEDEALALECLDAGAQDFLSKDEMRPVMLRRTIGYAITRTRETQVRELQELLVSYRMLSSAGRRTGVTASLMGVGPIKEQQPGAYVTLVEDYRGLIATYLPQLSYKKVKPTALMMGLVGRIGDLGGGPRDLLDIHVAALEDQIQGLSVEKTRFFVIDGRLLALEMMGLLVDYYRVGNRRLNLGGTA
jgi:CheY-like chemotaxis protein